MHSNPFRFEPADCFYSKLITVQKWIQEPHNTQDGALCNNCKRLKSINYYCKGLNLSYDRVYGSALGN